MRMYLNLEACNFSFCSSIWTH